MSKYIDLTGQRFGRLVVIKRADNNSKGQACWLCKCNCGNEKILSGIDLRGEHIISCGCYRVEKLIEAISKDIAGQKFGRLTVIRRVEKPKDSIRQTSFWLCKCDCGNEKIVSRNDLGRTVNSCGCLEHEPPTNFKDLTGQRFGRLVVIKRVEKPKEVHHKYYTPYWLCKCDCGNEKIASSGNLRSAHVASCGCYQKESRSLPLGEASINPLIGRYISGAKKRNLSFELSKEQFLHLTKENCFYCGKEPSYVLKNKYNSGNYTYNGIDRIDSTKGYTIENTVPCCGRCNQAKMKETQKDFLDWIERVYNHSIKDKR